MRVLLDTCVILDVLQDRKPFSKEAIQIYKMVASEEFEGCISAKSITDIYYIINRTTHNVIKTKEIINKLLLLFNLVDTKGIDCQKAILSDISDYEDAIMIETAYREQIDCIITRNEKDYKKSIVKVYTPCQFIDEYNKK